MQTRRLPALVAHAFVAFFVGCPCEAWTHMRSADTPSLGQKNTQYDPILKTCGTVESPRLRELHDEVGARLDDLLQAGKLCGREAPHVLPHIAW